MIMIFSIGSFHLRRDVERLEGPGGRIRYGRVPRGRAEPVQRAERSGRARGAPRARAVDLPPAHFPVNVCEFFIEIRICSRL